MNRKSFKTKTPCCSATTKFRGFTNGGDGELVCPRCYKAFKLVCWFKKQPRFVEVSA